jgi:hypothetical protein
MSSVLKQLGLEPEDDEHPADIETLGRLGLKPEEDEHPAQRMLGDRPLAPQETMPQAMRAPNRAAPERPTDPLVAIPRIAHQYMENASGPAAMIRQGGSEIWNNQPASGVGHIALGGAGLLGAGVQTAVTDPLTSLTGNPDFADKASMLVPFPAGGTATRGVSSAVNAIRPTTRALDFVAERMTPEGIERMRNNPRLRPMDVDQRVQNLATGAAKNTAEPRTMEPVVASMKQSASEAKNAVRGTYNEAMGEPPNLNDEFNRLKEQSQKVGKEQIEPRLKSAVPVDTSDVLVNIDKALNPTPVKMTPGTTVTQTPLQQRLTELRRDLASDKEVLTDPKRLHDIQSELRREAEDLQGSLTGSDRRLGGQLMNLRGQLVDAIDQSAPGYKDALSKYKDTMDIKRAFEMGRDVLKNGEKLEHDPSFLADWIKGTADNPRSPEELAAARLGARSAVERKMGSIKSSALDPGNSGTSIPQVDFNRQKLELLFGKDNTDKMFRHLQDERDIAVSNTRGLANSTTAEAQAAQKAMAPHGAPSKEDVHTALPAWAGLVGTGAGMLTNSTIGTAVGASLLGARGVKAGYDFVRNRADLSRNASIGNIVTRNDPENIASLVRAMDRVNHRNKLHNLLAPP